MATVADLVVNLSANSNNLNTGLAKGRRDVKAFAQDVNKDMGGAFARITPLIQSATYAVDDFVAGFSTGGFAGGIRGAGNNISQLGMQIGGVWGLIAGVGITLGFTLFDKIMKMSDDSEKSVDSLAKKLEGLRSALFKPTEMPGLQPTFADIESKVDALNPTAAGRRLDRSLPELSMKQANDVGLQQNAQLLIGQSQAFAKALGDELQLDLSSADATRKALIGNTVQTPPSLLEKMLGETRDLVPRQLEDKQRESLQSLLQAQQDAEKAIAAVTSNLADIETLQTERALLMARQTPLAAGSMMFANSNPNRVANGMGLGSLFGVGGLGAKLATQMPGMAREGMQLGDLNQSITDKLNATPGGKPSDNFAPAAEKGTLEAARLIFGAMGQNRTMELQRQQLDAQRAAVTELKKVGVTLKTTTKPMVVEEFTA